MLSKHALKLDQYKAFSGSYKPIITQLGLLKNYQN